MNNNILNNAHKTNELRASFLKECNVIDQKAEYGERFSGPRWLIATLLTEEELKRKYNSILNEYSPYLLISPAIGKVFSDYRKAEENYEKQLKRKQVMSFEEGVTDQVFSEITHDDYYTELEREYQANECVDIIKNVLSQCSETEQERIRKVCFEHKSINAVAKEENVAYNAVFQSVTSCRAKIAEALAASGRIKIITINGVCREVRI